MASNRSGNERECQACCNSHPICETWFLYSFRSKIQLHCDLDLEAQSHILFPATDFMNVHIKINTPKSSSI